MTENEFRKLALAAPGAVEAGHMGHPDFRIGGKIFASLGPSGSKWAMVRLTPAHQRAMIAAHGAIFSAFAGAWGKRGCTRISLPAAKRPIVNSALSAAAEFLQAELNAKTPSGKRKVAAAKTNGSPPRRKSSAKAQDGAVPAAADASKRTRRPTQRPPS